ncbi:MAG: alpha/beta hydrolase family protein [Gammaproteobacteria bacterium]|nr:alpha/beta hydrolase family protein [Gammaproteobacteria bacterium]
MSNLHLQRIFLVTIGLLISGISFAADHEREQRIANQIVDSIMDGESLELSADGREFLAIEMESDSDSVRGAAIILHGRGLHPEWEQVIKPLRTLLPERGWHTLSLQMPVLNKGAKYFDYVPTFPESYPRIEAAIAHLKQKGFKRIVLIAHSCGAHMAMNWIDLNGDDQIAGYVGIGMGATDYKQKMVKPFPLDKMKVPILDLYGEEDFPAVIRMAPERLSQIQKAGNRLSKQIRVDGSDHYFVDKGDELVEAVSGWLNETYK